MREKKMDLPDKSETVEHDSRGMKVREYSRQTCGSESLHRHWTGLLIYTDGALFVAEVCGAHWLIDAVASHQTTKSVRREPFQVWRLRKTEDSTEHWILDAWTDTPDKSDELVRQVIMYSDFPVDLAPFEFWVENSTMMLKEER